MIIKTRYILLLVTFITGLAGGATAQSGFYIPNTGRIFFVGDTATIFSNVLNTGKFGIGKTAVVNFKGRNWENDPLSLITDSTLAGDGVNGVGGLVRFLLDTAWQQLSGGYNAVTRTGPAFSQLEINNLNGVYLTGSTAKIKQELRLSRGLFYLGNNILVVGNGNPGIITGYNDQQYLVTGNAPGMGLLLRENITLADGLVVFPIGSRAAAYTPAAVLSRTPIGDDYYMGVFDSVKSQATTGNNLQDSSVNKTWEMGKRFRPNQDDADIVLQHLLSDEGSIFRSHRQTAYIAAYINNKWDTALPQAPPVAGYLTTGAPLATGGVNTRTTAGLIRASTFFTKFTGTGIPLPVLTRVWLSAQRIDGQKVKVTWTTRPEVDNHFFVVQRKLANQSEFISIDTVLSKAPNGNSWNYLNYLMNDNNSFTGLSYYRLKIVNLMAEEAYSNIVPVKGRPGGYALTLYPNPSTGRFFVGITGTTSVRTIVIWDVAGRKVFEERVAGRNLIEMHLYIPGTYLVSFLSESGELIETKKLLVQPWY